VTTGGALLGQARRAAGSSQQGLTHRAGTARTALSAYEHGARSPALDTALRLLAPTGMELTTVPRAEVIEQATSRGRTVPVPTRLPRLALADAVATVTLPVHLNWSAPGRLYRLGDRSDRARVYETVLREGTAADVLTYIDGAVLVDVWDGARPAARGPRRLGAADRRWHGRDRGSIVTV
jgi:transcriptional regulator with XRE-family HTH domain